MKQVIKVSQCENEVLVSDRLCSRLNVDGISDVCEVNVDLMIGVGTGRL